MSSRQAPRVRPGPVGLTALVLAALPALFGPIAYGAARWWVAGLLAAISFLSLALWMAARPRGLGAWCLPGGFRGLALWCAWLALLGVFYAPVPHASLTGVLHAASCLASGCVVADVTARDRRAGTVLLVLFFLVICLEGGYAIVQYSQDGQAVLFAQRAPEYANRASGTYINPNHFAHLLSMGICAGTAFAFWKKGGFTVRLFGAAAALLAAPALLGSLSRTGMIATVAGLWTVAVLLAVAQNRRTAALVVLAGPFLAGLVAWVSLLAFPVLRDRWSPDLLLQDGRLQIWRDCLEMLAARPAWGWGVGMFEDVASLHRNHYMDYWTTLNHAHNEGLQIAVEQGLEGVWLLAVATFCLAASCVRMFKQAREGGDAALAAGLIGAVAATAVHSMFDFNLQLFANNHAAMLLLAVGASKSRARSRLNADPPARVPPALRAAVAVVALAAAGAACATWLGALHQVSAARYLETRDYDPARALRSLEKGRRVDPLNPYFPLELGSLAVTRAWWAKDPAERVRWTDEAEGWFNRAARLRPFAQAVDEGRIDVLELRGDLEGALALARTVAEQRRASIHSAMDVGHILRLTGRYPEAMEAYVAAWLRSGCREEWIRSHIRAMKALVETHPEPPETPPARSVP